MKPEIEGLDAPLERRLRAAVAGRQPEPPEDLVEFIDTVVAGPVPRRHRLPILGRRGRVARGLLLAAASILIVAIASGAIVYVRSSHNPGAGSGWTWRTPAEVSLRAVRAQLPNGYVGDCGSGDKGPVPCSSRDGVSWSTPIDPAIAVLQGDSADQSMPFLPQNVFEIGGVRVGISPGVGPASLIRSTDGVHWTAVQSDAIDSVLGQDVGACYVSQLSRSADRFALIAGQCDGEGWALTSADGLAWTKTSKLPVSLGGDSTGGIAGLFVVSPDGQKVWRTVDGVSWTPADLGGSGLPQVPVALPGGGYIAQGMRVGGILKSADGSTWRIDQGNLVGYPTSMVVVGGRLVAGVSATPYGDGPMADSPVWESLDWGSTWQPVIGPDGAQMVGFVGIVSEHSDIVTILQGAGLSQHVAYVGFLAGR